MKNTSAQELGRLSAKSRFKGMSKKQRSEAMRKVRKGNERLTKIDAVV